MAQRLTYTPRPRTADEIITEARNDSQDALLESLELLRELHAHGVLDTLVKLVRAGDGLTTKTLQMLEGDSATRLLRNVLELGRTFSELDPDSIGTLGKAADAGLREGARRVQAGEGVGLGELLGLLKDPDIQAALGALFGTLKGFGRALRDARGETTESEGQRRPDEEKNKNRKRRKEM
ncbi:DUF1641 domain-containing protein [Deinococcus sp. KNUC1210]|uniref:DUF1641 domain-containing protein n=1 Tax=Deinococcus sp. KNUC1210 TaxID=2917691 RepID=UPI001EF11E64|nr:DUF1641 domain-containing protein [Deinococcus sp. KNUC1210]ULH16324.1 DUF1641 domain-containing protein [Deinococcus sp. KNUC1210]